MTAEPSEPMVGPIDFDESLWSDPADEFGRSVVMYFWLGLMELTVPGERAIERMDFVARWNTPYELYEDFWARNDAIFRYKDRRWVSDSVCKESQRLMDRMDSARDRLGEEFWTLDALRTSVEWDGIRQHAAELAAALKDWVESVGLRIDRDDPFKIELDHLR